MTCQRNIPCVLGLLVLAQGCWSAVAICALGTTSTDLIQQRGYDLSGQTHVITGGDSGIGFGIAVALAQANARIIFLGHDMKKTAAVMRNITNRTSNTKLSSIPINLMSLASVKTAADSILAANGRIDALICDAGLIHPIPVPVTADGFESTVQIEYISHFYLVELLLPELRKTRGRVVHTSSIGIDSYTVKLKSGLPGDSPLTMGTLSKVAREPNQAISAVRDGNIFMGLWMKSMHARILAHKEAASGVTAYSFHPGLVASSGDIQAFYDQYGGKDALVQICTPGSSIEKFLPGTGMVQKCQQNVAWKSQVEECPFVNWYSCLFPEGATSPLTSEQGAVTGAYLAAAPKADLASINGALTVACDYVPLVYGDPYVEMVGNIGLDATAEFLESFYDLSLSWVPSLTQSEFADMGLKHSGVGFCLWTVLILLFASTAIIGVWSRRQSDNGGSSYMPLA